MNDSGGQRAEPQRARQPVHRLQFAPGEILHDERRLGALRQGGREGEPRLHPECERRGDRKQRARGNGRGQGPPMSRDREQQRKQQQELRFVEETAETDAGDDGPPFEEAEAGADQGCGQKAVLPDIGSRHVPDQGKPLEVTRVWGSSLKSKRGSCRHPCQNCDGNDETDARHVRSPMREPV